MQKKLESTFSRRQYMMSRDFEIYYYNGYKLSPVEAHHHDYYEIYFFLEGSVEICVEGRTLSPAPGDLVIVPPEKTHFPRILSYEKPYRRIVLWVGKDYIQHLLEESEDYGYLFGRVDKQKEYLYKFSAVQSNQLQGMAFRMIEESWGERYGKRTALLLLLNELLLALNRTVYEQKHRNRKRSGQEEQVYQMICSFINSHLEEDLSLDRLSKQFFLNKYYIAHLFKDKVGMSAHQYITGKRLAACKDAMLGDEPIGQICHQYGFSDYTSFYRRFKKEYGISPKEYRQSHQLEE
ncbi:MAG: AraC family transcriptional regulator [Fusicatenibacter sp.]|nr:AraC family transcriptional regulator [Fusicatenibacter sp.]